VRIEDGTKIREGYLCPNCSLCPAGKVCFRDIPVMKAAFGSSKIMPQECMTGVSDAYRQTK